MLDGSNNNPNGNCGRPGELIYCDASPLSAFFHPSRLHHVCKGLRRAGSNGSQLIGKIYSGRALDFAKLGVQTLPVSAEATSCGTLKNKQLYSTEMVRSDWLGIKDLLIPPSTSAFLSGRVEELRKPLLLTFNASVEHRFFALANLKLKESLKSREEACRPCQLASTNLLDAAKKLDTLYCPRRCVPQVETILLKTTGDTFSDRRHPKGAAPEELQIRGMFIKAPASDPSLLAQLEGYFDQRRAGVRNEGEVMSLAATAKRTINLLHPFRDGNGRVAVGIMNLVLESAGLPHASLEHNYYEWKVGEQKFERFVEAGVKRSIEVVEGCSAYVHCVKEKQLGSVATLCDLPPQGECAKLLPKVELSSSKVHTLAPCDCSTRWKEQHALFPGCKD